MLNRVILMGRITKDLEIRQSQSGTAVLRFTVAVDRPQKNGEKSADFINCVAFGQTAEFIGRYFGKGRMIALEGNIKTGRYEKEGITFYTQDVWVDNVSFTGEPQNGGNAQGYSNTNNSYNLPQSAPQNVTGTYKDYKDIMLDDGVSF